MNAKASGGAYPTPSCGMFGMICLMTFLSGKVRLRGTSPPTNKYHAYAPSARRFTVVSNLLTHLPTMDSAGPSPSQPLLRRQRTDSASLEPDQSSLGRTVSRVSSLREDEFLSLKSPERPGWVTPSPTTTYSVYRLPRSASGSLRSASLGGRSHRPSDSLEELTGPKVVLGPSVPILNHPPEPASRAESVQDSGFPRRESIATANAVKEGGTTDSLPDFQRPKTKVITILAEVLGILAPLGFLAFAIALICIHGSKNDPSAQYINTITIVSRVR